MKAGAGGYDAEMRILSGILAIIAGICSSMLALAALAGVVDRIFTYRVHSAYGENASLTGLIFTSTILILWAGFNGFGAFLCIRWAFRKSPAA